MQYLYYKCLLRRLPKTHAHYSTLQEEFSRLDAGLAGEQRVAREMLDIPYNYVWLKNFQCLSPQNTPHQIDFIILCPHFAVVLEVKNMSGHLFFQPESKEFYRARLDGQVDFFRSPFDQAIRHQQLLEQLFEMWNTPLPVTYAVVSTNTNSRIGTTFEDLPIFHVSYLRIFLSKLLKRHPPMNIDVIKLKEKLQSYSVVFPPRKLVNNSDLLTGVLCSVCHAKMTFSHGVAICTVCNHRTRNGILETLRDYYYLVDTTISNREFRWFSEIYSKARASKTLLRLPLKTTGNHRSTRYIIPENLISFDS